MDNKFFIPILLGTIRNNRQSEFVANYIFEKLKSFEIIESTIVDPRKMNLPSDDEGEDLRISNIEYKNIIERADGYIIVTPEYNHGYPGSLKRMLDVLFEEYNRKPVGLVGVSNGTFGGARAVEGLLPVMKALGLLVIKPTIYFPNVDSEIFIDGKMTKDDKYSKSIEKFTKELIWITSALKTAREQKNNE